MTDKQIIIDGIDVNALRSDEIACMNRYEVARLFIKTIELLVANEQECETLASQLDFEVQKKECLEQECERLKEQLKTLDDEDITYQLTEEQYKEYDQLKAENEELKNTIMQKCPQCGEVYLNPIGCELYEQIDQLKAENEKLKNFHINLVGVKECEIRELARYKQAIEKIKEICKNVMPTGIDEETDKFGDILQICDEVNDV